MLYKTLQDNLTPGLSPKSFIVVTGFMEHMGVFYATTICYGFLSLPRKLTSRASGRQRVKPSTRGMPWGLALHNIKAPAVPEVLYGCVVAQENPPVLVREVATSLFFPFPAVKPCA
jgi:hypothetical protein